MVSYQSDYEKLLREYYKNKKPNETILDDKDFRQKYFNIHKSEILRYLTQNSYRHKGRPPLWLQEIKKTEKSLKVNRGNFFITFN